MMAGIVELGESRIAAVFGSGTAGLISVVDMK
jgi:hypothetical protein